MERWNAENMIIRKSDEYEYLTDIQAVESLANTVKLEINNIYEIQWRDMKKNAPKTKFGKWQEVEDLLKAALKILEDE